MMLHALLAQCPPGTTSPAWTTALTGERVTTGAPQREVDGTTAVLQHHPRYSITKINIVGFQNKGDQIVNHDTERPHLNQPLITSPLTPFPTHHIFPVRTY